MCYSAIKALADKLYQGQPDRVLYHYTSISGMMAIVSSKVFWASEIRYLNDATELKHLQQLVVNAVQFAEEQSDAISEISRQFGKWLTERVQNGPLVFVVSLTERGNLLSQWRGYTPHGQGVSLGFQAQHLAKVTAGAPFTLGKCIYDHKRHIEIVVTLLNAIVAEAQNRGPSDKKDPSQSYYAYFEEVEEHVLRICALLKHPSFAEESEWRAVSQTHPNYVIPLIKYRPGKSFLIPYIEMPLSLLGEGLVMPHVVVGPTPTPDLSMASISMYLSKYAPTTEPRMVQNSMIPYRE
jgi:hypothetical protein